MPATETRTEAVARWERDGLLDPTCAFCQREWYANDKMPWEVFAPNHKASDHCQSGKRPHCSCDLCF